MTESATSLVVPRERRRLETAHRITVHAQRLVDVHGIDGFTMEDLAEAAGVSRRTLFNYFDSKLDAILGRIPEVTEELIEQFRAGGPTGDLVDDLGVLVEAVLSNHEVTREEVVLSRRVLAEPRLLAASHARLASYAEPFIALIREREGPSYDEQRGRIAVVIFIALADTALDGYVEDTDGRSLAAIYLDLLTATRSLMAPAPGAGPSPT